jgi:hypothetical protein
MHGAGRLMAWSSIPFNAALLANADETTLHSETAGLENAYVGDAQQITRFPGLVPFASIGSGRVYLTDWQNDLIALTSAGQVWRIDPAGKPENVTDFALTGGRRPTVAKTETALLAASGGPILAFDGYKTRPLSSQAPLTTHIGYVARQVVAIEPQSGRFSYSDPGQPDVWNPLSVFSAEGKPDGLTALWVTEFGELLACGPDSIEQYDASGSADAPFARRYVAGDGISAPYTLVNEDNATWGLNRTHEFVRLSGQTTTPKSQAVQAQLEAIDDFTEAWATRMRVFGQRFILVQFPHATNAYGTAGVTLLYDVRHDRWSSLYGWDAGQIAPARWPGWSYATLWGRHFIGGEGVIWELKADAADWDGVQQRVRIRTGHLAPRPEAFRIDNVRLRLRRGDRASGATPGLLSVRANKDNRGFGRWKRLPMGVAGDRTLNMQLGAFGWAETIQFELEITDGVPLQLSDMAWDVGG